MNGNALGRRADIQGMRALAVVLVVLFHAGLGFSGGFIGVDVFFVISGFVITLLLLGEIGRTDTLMLGRFYLRRIRRLMPALGLLIVVVGLLAILAAPVGVQPLAARTGVSASVFLGNFYLYKTPTGYFALDTNLNPFLHTWSLAVEEQFYLVFPLLLLGSWRLGRRGRHPQRWAIVTLTVVALISFTFAAAMVDGRSVFPGIGAPREFAFYSSLTRAWEFAAGALLAFGVNRLRALPPVTATALGWLGAVLVVGPALRYDALTPFPGADALPPVFGTMLMLAAGVGGTRGIGRSLATRPAVWIGDISYSWYLWHWPAIVFGRALWPGSWTAGTAAALSIVPAWLSYRFVENPIRRSPRLTPRGTLLMGAATIAAAILACGVLVLGHRGVVRTAGYASVREALRTHQACPVRGQGLESRSVGDPEIAVRCTWPVAGARGTVALLGDSNAGHIAEPIVRAARAEGQRTYVATSNGCPFVDVTMIVDGERREDCRHFYERSLRAVDEMRPHVVVIGSSTTRYLDETQFGIVVGRAGPTATSAAAKARAWEAGVRRTVEWLARRHVRAIVVHPVPKYPGWDLRGCAAGRIVGAEFTCGASTSRASAVRANAAGVAAEEAAIRGQPNATAVSFLPQLCSPTVCSTDRAHTWLYHDGDHLSIKGALTLTPRMEAALADAFRSG